MSSSSGSIVCPPREFLRTNLFLHHEQLPIHQNLVMQNGTVTVGIERGDLEIVVWSQGRFVYNRPFDLFRLSYAVAYDNNQACSPAFRKYLGKLVHSLVFERNVRGCCVVRCSDGSFCRG